jgi:AcrR family transcriptional regulator
LLSSDCATIGEAFRIRRAGDNDIKAIDDESRRRRATQIVRKDASSRQGRPTAARAAAITEGVLSAAATLFLRDGFDGISMEAVAAQAGVPKTTLYKRYHDKSALLRAVLADRLKTWSAVASQENHRLTDDLTERLCVYTEIMLFWATTPEVRAFRQLSAALAVAQDRSGGGGDFSGRAGMIDLLERDIAHFGPPVTKLTTSPRTVASALMALVSGWLDLRHSTVPMTSAEARSEAEFLVSLLTRGHAAW